MKTSDFNYTLPTELIAQTPLEPRDDSRLMVLNRSDGSINHCRFFDIPTYLKSGDVLVFNNSRVIPARLIGSKVGSGGKVEILLLRQLGKSLWEALIKRRNRVNIGSKIVITDNCVAGDPPRSGVIAEVVAFRQNGIVALMFSDESQLFNLGTVPLPPYIYTPLLHAERYQTIYASIDGSVAAPTAGLHFTTQLLNKINQKGIQCLFVTLHIGLDTFQPVREKDPRQHIISKEYGVINREVASQLSQAKAEGRRIVCVGTTSVRIIEQATQAVNNGAIKPFEDWVRLFILPGYRFRMVDALITNFHLPKSTLLMLVTAFAGKDFIERAYQEAISACYRFYSFGDAMLII